MDGGVEPVACKALEATFPLDKVTEKLLLLFHKATRDLIEFAWRIREVGNIQKLSCKKGSYFTLAEFSDKRSREFAAPEPIALDARTFVIDRGYEGLQVLLTVDFYERSGE